MQSYLVILFSLLLDSILFVAYQSLIPHKYNLNQNLHTLDLNRNLFSQFELYSPLNPEHYNDDPIVEANFDAPNMGLINSEDYCEKVDYENIREPKDVMNFITDYNDDGLARQLMKSIGNVVVPDHVSKDMSKADWNSRSYQIPKNGTIIFTKKTRFHYFHQFNKHFFCQT
jgi:hypothetical protein